MILLLSHLHHTQKLAEALPTSSRSDDEQVFKAPVQSKHKEPRIPVKVRTLTANLLIKSVVNLHFLPKIDISAIL